MKYDIYMFIYLCIVKGVHEKDKCQIYLSAYFWGGMDWGGVHKGLHYCLILKQM